MKIAFLAPGNSIHTIKWINAIAQRGHNVSLFTLKTQKVQEPIDKNIQVVYLNYTPPVGYFLAAHRLRRLINGGDFDVVNAHYASGYGTLARLAGVRPLLLNVWGSDVYDFPYESKIKKSIIKQNLLYADRIASTSNVMARQVRRLLNSPEMEIDITPFGVDTVNKFCPASVKKESREHPVIGIIKTLEPQYGINYLIEAFAIVCDKWDGTNFPVLEIYGRGSQLEELKALAQKLNVLDRVRFMGFIEHSKVPEALSNFDLFVAASDHESFGVAVVEAMAMELPVVATDVDGFTEVVDDGVTGVLVPRKNSKALAEAIYDMLVRPDLMRRMGEAGRKRAIELYDWKKNVDTMEAIYRSLCGK